MALLLLLEFVTTFVLSDLEFCTARIGARGNSVIFLLPSEAGFVKNLEAARILLAEMTLRQVIILILVLILHYYSGAAETAVVQRDLQHWAHPQIHGEGGLRPAAADEEEIKASSWLQDLACQALVLEA